jgi:hypothetical protein
LAFKPLLPINAGGNPAAGARLPLAKTCPGQAGALPKPSDILFDEALPLFFRIHNSEKALIFHRPCKFESFANAGFFLNYQIHARGVIVNKAGFYPEFGSMGAPWSHRRDRFQPSFAKSGITAKGFFH